MLLAVLRRLADSCGRGRKKIPSSSPSRSPLQDPASDQQVCNFRDVPASVKRLSLIFLAIFSTLLPRLRAQTTVSVTGGDAGQGLTLNAANVVLAWNVGSSSSFAVQGVRFTGQTALPSVANYLNAFNFSGSETSSDDIGLQGVLQSLAFIPNFNGGIQFTLTGLVANASYHLDLLQSVGRYNRRTQTISINGGSQTLVTLGDYAVNTTYITTASNLGQIAVQLVESGPGTADGAVLSGFVVTTVPEPSTYAALAGLGAIGFAVYRRKGTEKGVIVPPSRWISPVRPSSLRFIGVAQKRPTANLGPDGAVVGFRENLQRFKDEAKVLLCPLLAIGFATALATAEKATVRVRRNRTRSQLEELRLRWSLLPPASRPSPLQDPASAQRAGTVSSTSVTFSVTFAALDQLPAASRAWIP